MDTITGPRQDSEKIPTPSTGELEQITGMSGSAVEAQEASKHEAATGEEAKGILLEEYRNKIAATADTTNAMVNERDARESAGFTPEAIQSDKEILGQQRDTNRLAADQYQEDHLASLTADAEAQAAQFKGDKEPAWDRFKHALGFGKEK